MEEKIPKLSGKLMAQPATIGNPVQDLLDAIVEASPIIMRGKLFTKSTKSRSEQRQEAHDKEQK